MSNTTGTPTTPPKSAARRIALSLLALVVVAGGVATAAYWFAIGQHHVTTDDAYVSGDIVEITSEVPGTVIALHADNTQSVTTGTPLIELDPADADIEMQSAEANLALAVRQVRTLFAQADQLRAQVASNQTTLERAQSDYRRRLYLVGDGGISAEELAHARDNIAELSAGVDAAKAALAATEAQTAGTTIADHPTVLAAAERLRSAALSLRRAEIISPIDGIVAKRAVQIGQHVDPGTPLMAVVPTQDVWVDANLKEVQLEHIRIGQPVAVHADVYGNDMLYHGRVAGIAAGSGNIFALLPAQNASGNWIKIVQRLPVRILLDPNELRAHPLELGLSATVDIDVSKTEDLPATPVRNSPQPSRPSDGADPGVTSLIAHIINDNSGTPAEVAKGDAP